MPNLNFADYKALTGDNTVTGWVKYNWLGSSTTPSPSPEPEPSGSYSKYYDFTNEQETNNFISDLIVWPSTYDGSTQNYKRSGLQTTIWSEPSQSLYMTGIVLAEGATGIRSGLYFSFEPGLLTNNVTVEMDLDITATGNYNVSSKQSVFTLFNTFNGGTVDGPRLALSFDPNREEGKFYWTWRRFTSTDAYEDYEFANTNAISERNKWKFNYDFDNQVITVYKNDIPVITDNTSCAALDLYEYNLSNNSFSNSNVIKQNTWALLYSAKFTEQNPGE